MYKIINPYLGPGGRVSIVFLQCDVGMCLMLVVHWYYELCTVKSMTPPLDISTLLHTQQINTQINMQQCSNIIHTRDKL